MATGRARAFAAALRGAGALRYAEPNVALARQSALDADPGGYARGYVVDPALTPPAPGAVTIAVVDDLADITHPDLAGHTTQANPGPVLGPHGTEVASAAAGALNGFGVVGVFPGAPVLSVGLPPKITCADAANGIVAASRAGAKVINLSIGSPSDCTTLFGAVQIAFARGSLVVAASGNEFGEGNPVIFPAAYPHVLSVASLNPSLAPSFFSTAERRGRRGRAGRRRPGREAGRVRHRGRRARRRHARQRDELRGADRLRRRRLAGHRPARSHQRPARRHAAPLGARRRSARLRHEHRLRPRQPRRRAGAAGARARRARAQRRHHVRQRLGVHQARPVRLARHAASAPSAAAPTRSRIRTTSTASGCRERSRAQIRLRPGFGNPDLFIFRGSARTIDDDESIVARSRKTGQKTDSVTIRNPGGSARRFYVAIGLGNAGAGLNASYNLQFQRLKYR